MTIPQFARSRGADPEPFPPEWACAWGDDRHGLWADAELEIFDTLLVQRMRWIAAGTFLMGSPPGEIGRGRDEGPQHQVTISQGFWLADGACTQTWWQALMGANPSKFHLDNRGGPLHPLDRVGWDGIQEFLKKLENYWTSCRATLPTEAEWEYACRAGSRTPFSFGATITPAHVNSYGGYPYDAGDKGENRTRTVAVKALPPNPWGLYQMHGNVQEWCADRKRDYGADAVVDPGLQEALAAAPADEDAGVLRGGGWRNSAQAARSACRVAPDRFGGNSGFRFVLRSRPEEGGV